MHGMNNEAGNTVKKRALMLLVRGLPGSGKTFIATQLADSLPAGQVVMLDPDAIDFESKVYHEHVQQQIAEGVDPILHAYRFLRAQAYQGIADGKIIIWNQPFTNREIFEKMTANFYAQAKEHNVELDLLVVEVMTDPDEAKRRVEKRKAAGGHGPSENTFNRFVNDYKSFADDGYKTVTVSGQDSVEQSVATILQAMPDARAR